MPKRIRVERHLSTEELEKRYREASDGVRRSHYQIVWLLSEGKLPPEEFTRPEVAEVLIEAYRAG